MMGEGSFNVSEEKSSSLEEKRAETAASSLLNKEVDPSCYRYEGDKYYYTDPISKIDFEWNENKKEWFPSNRDIPSFSSKDYSYDGDTYFYTDKATNRIYKWDKEKNEWIAEMEQVKTGLKITNKKPLSDDEELDEGESKPEIKRQDMTQGVYGYDGKHHTYTDNRDGTIYFWDNDANAWFPKVDDDFLAQYQMNYGFNTPEPQTTSNDLKSEVKPSPAPETLKRKQDAMEEKNDNLL